MVVLVILNIREPNEEMTHLDYTILDKTNYGTCRNLNQKLLSQFQQFN